MSDGMSVVRILKRNLSNKPKESNTKVNISEDSRNSVPATKFTMINIVENLK